MKQKTLLQECYLANSEQVLRFPISACKAMKFMIYLFESIITIEHICDEGVKGYV